MVVSFRLGLDREIQVEERAADESAGCRDLSGMKGLTRINKKDKQER